MCWCVWLTIEKASHQTSLLFVIVCSIQVCLEINFTPFNKSDWMFCCGVDTKSFFFSFFLFFCIYIMANLLHSLLYDNAVIASAVCYFRCYFLVLTVLYCVCTIAMAFSKMGRWFKRIIAYICKINEGFYWICRLI